jgi:lipopolysaccharide export system permease protein
VREFISMGVPMFAILLGIVIFTLLIRLLGESVSGILAVDGVFALLGFGAMNYLPMLLSISLFLSVLLTLTRSYSENEMLVWFCSGIGLTRWIRPVLVYALPVVGLIALLSLVLSPWAMSKTQEFRHQLDNRDVVSAATPGAFRESKNDESVYFIENVFIGKNRVGKIFTQSVQHGKVGTMVAKQGLQETAPNGDRFLVLLNGTRYEGKPGQMDFKIVEFERYAMRIEVADSKNEEDWQSALSTLHLLQNPTSWNLSELEWRLGLPLSALVLALLAIPMSFVNPRAGRSLNLIMAIVIYMVYNNMISVANAWVGQEKIGPVMGLVVIHSLMFALMMLLFYHRMSTFSWRQLLR